MENSFRIQEMRTPSTLDLILKKSYKIVEEGIKIFAITKFFEMLGSYYFTNFSKISKKRIYVLTVFDPLIEEIIFRGIILKLIRFVQRANSAQQQKKNEMIIRIQLSALILSSVHFFNTDSNRKDKILQCTSAYLSGVCYGHVFEKYQTLSASIFVHAINNILSVACILGPSRNSPFFLVALFANKVFALILATTSLDQRIARGCKRIIALFHNCRFLRF